MPTDSARTPAAATAQAATAHSATVFDTIVVGAGVSGLTAAGLLARAGQRVVVFEARERIGGRLWTIIEPAHTEADSGTLESPRTAEPPTTAALTSTASHPRARRVTDMGASWIHGIDNSPLWDLTQAFGMRPLEFTVGSFQPGGRPIAYFGPDGARLSEAESQRFIDDVHTFDTKLADVIVASPHGSSYRDAVEEALRELGWAADRAERVREFMQHRTEEQYGAWIADLDAHGLDDDAIEGDEVIFPDGYAQLAHHLAAGLDVRLEHPVSSVEWSDAGVHVTTTRGAFTAHRAVVTVPIGVLRSDDFRIDPPLPEPVSGALAGLTMNAFEKVFLRFPERFWEADVYTIRQQGKAGDWWHSWYDVSAVDGEPALLTFAAGPCARETRDWSDEHISASVMDALRRLYGDDVPQPTGVHISRWQHDPWARGSYAYMMVGSKPEDHDLMATPVGGVLHLAGEATWTDDPATVSAALLSGHRAAGQILGHSPNLSALAQPVGAPAP